MTMMTTTIQEIKRELFNALNAVEFNSRDERWGTEMAHSNPDRWSPKAIFLLAKMMVKYQGQVSHLGIDLSVLDGLTSIADVEAMMPQKKQINVVKMSPVHGMSVHFAYNSSIVEQVKSIPYGKRGFVNKDGEKYWWVDVSDDSAGAEAARLLWGIIQQFDFVYDEEVKTKLLTAINEGSRPEKRVEASDSFATDAEIEIPGLRAELRGFQKAGVIYASKAKRTFIADEMGLGKTIQALGAIEHANAYPALIVCRSNLLTNWIREIRKFLPGRKIGKPVVDQGSDIILVSHHELVKFEKWLSLERDWKAVVADESHDFKGHKSQRTLALKQICKRSNPEYRILLTGTPIPNKPKEFIAQLDILGRMNDFGGWKGFTNRYCNAFQGPFGMDINGCSNLEELNNKLRSTCYIRRMKKDVLSELPEKQRSTVFCQIDNRKAYEEAEARTKERIRDIQNGLVDYVAQMRKTIENSDNVWELLNILQEISPKMAEKYEVALNKGQEILPNEIRHLIYQQIKNKHESIIRAHKLMLIRQLQVHTAREKYHSFLEWVKDMVESVGKVAIFAFSREFQEKLAKDIPNAVWTRDNKRFSKPQEAVDEFSGNSEVQVIIMSLKGDNVGLNGVQNVCSNVVFFEYDWVFSTHEQAEDRAHRMGQQDSVNVYYYQAENTIEEKIWDTLMEKKAISEKAVDGVVTTKSIGGDLLNWITK